MRQTDIVIVGGGAAGSAAAAMLARAGIAAILIDPHPVYPPDFRCEKIDASQARLLERAGLSAILDAATPGGEVRVARLGRLVDRRRSAPSGIRYDHLVNRLRAEIPATTEIVAATVTAIAATSDRQTVTLSTGEHISARLVVLANGLNARLRRSLGIHSHAVSRCHSISIGFDLEPLGKHASDLSALTCYPERLSDGMAYLTLFRIGPAMRANLFVYWDAQDPRLAAFRASPAEALAALCPSLRRLAGPFRIAGPVKIRPVDLTASTHMRQAGFVLVGDAFATSCPAAGTGLNKVLTDVERLCAVHIPRWLASDGMGADKIAAFYDDPVKRRSDADSAAQAFRLRSLSIQPGLAWSARRWSRLVGQVGIGVLRRTGTKVSAAMMLLAAGL